MFYNIKKSIIKKSIEKKKLIKPFDIEIADNFVLAADAKNEMNNSHYFLAFDENTNERFYFRLGKRGGDYDDEIWFMYRDKNGVIYLQEDEQVAKGKTLPASAECVEVGKKLKFSFNGNVYPASLGKDGYLPDKSKKPVKVNFDGEFTSSAPIFEFMYHLSSETTASALAKEKLKNLEAFGNIQQVHYEQSGTICADFTLDGQAHSFKNLKALRDHSYGPREWCNFDRYIWTIILLENGEFIHTSLIRYPQVRELAAGFKINGNSVISLRGATSMNDLPVTGNVPPEFNFTVEYVDGSKKEINSKLDFVVPFTFKGDFKVNEGFADFIVDGVKGVGISEFGFNPDKSRWTR